MHTKLLTVAVCFGIFATQVNASTVLTSGNESSPQVIATLKDKNGKSYQFRETYSLTKAGIIYTYDFGSDGKYEIIFSGKTYSDAEICPYDDTSKFILADNAVLVHQISKKDFNSDKIEDILLFIVKQDCRTHELLFMHMMLLSTENGFKLEQTQHKEFKR